MQLKSRLTAGEALAALDGAVRALRVFGSDRRRPLTWHPMEVRARLGKWLVFFRLACRGDPGGAVKTVNLVAKIYGTDRGAVALGALKTLRAAGFRPPGPHRVPAVYGYAPGFGVLIQERAPGIPWADFLTGGAERLAAASARAADWLVQLQGSSAPAGPHGRGSDIDRIGRFGEELADNFGSRGAPARRLGLEVIGRLNAGSCPALPSHGDYHPQNVLLARRVTSGVDFDAFGLREPAFDAGYAVGQLLIMSYFRLGTFEPGGRGALAFWQRYHEVGGHAPWDRVAVHVARCFIESLHYELCVLRNVRTELLQLWTQQADLWLGSNGPATLERLAGRGRWGP